MDIYSIGEMVIDFTPGREPNSFIRNAGGAPANVAIAAKRSGVSSAMCCSVGDDDFGRFLQATLRENGVDIIYPRLCTEATTTMAFVNLDSNGERSFVFARKPGADMFLPAEAVQSSDIMVSKIINAGSCSLSASPIKEATIKALKLAHQAHKLVAFDINYRALMWQDDVKACLEAVRDILPYVDLLKMSAEEAELFGNDENIKQLMQEYDISVCLKTLGADGVDYYFEKQIFHQSTRVVKAVDTTAAGDAFWGAFLARLLRQNCLTVKDLNIDIIKDAVTYGNIAGSLCVEKKGAISALPNLAKIEAIL